VDGVRVVRLRRLAGTWPRRISYLANLFGYVLRHGRSFDVVHVHLANLQADAAVLAARIAGVGSHVKVANSGTHGETRRLSTVARVTRWYGLRHADSVQALSQETADELARVAVRPERVVKIPNGVLLPSLPRDRSGARQALGLPQDEGIVLFAGRFARYKGLDDLIAAWAVVSRRGWMLLLVGEEAEDDPYEAGVDLARVELRPWVDSIQPYLDAADVFVLPSHSEGMSNALLEAMASGRTVVSSDTGAATEMIEDEVSGLVHGTGDVPALVESLGRVMDDEQLRTRLAEGARRRAEEFSVESVVGRLEQVYQRIGRR
jgi:glycosyltransferase involved in cell wall biosynthesis